MIWLYPYRFVLNRKTTSAFELVQALGKLSDRDTVNYRIKENHLQLWIKGFGRNSWRPVFDGRLVQIGPASELRGSFRLLEGLRQTLGLRFRKSTAQTKAA